MVQRSLASCMAFLMVLLHLGYSEVECGSLICFFNLRRSSHSASINDPRLLYALAFPYNLCCYVTHCCVESVGQFVHIYICIMYP